MKHSHLRRIYISDQDLYVKQHISIDGNNFHYLKVVLRAKISDTFRIFNNQEEFLAEVLEISKSTILAKITEFIRVDNSKKKNITLAMGIIKYDRMLEAIRGVVQLGVMKIIPIISERTQYHTINKNKIDKCIIQSCIQSERFYPPQLLDITTLENFCAQSNFDHLIFANESEQKHHNLKDLHNTTENITILIGPEGGFSDNEISMINSCKSVSSISLGNNILRAEIAAISVVSYFAIMI